MEEKLILQNYELEKGVIYRKERICKKRVLHRKKIKIQLINKKYDYVKLNGKMINLVKAKKILFKQ